jgi:hypothetical protein
MEITRTIQIASTRFLSTGALLTSTAISSHASIVINEIDYDQPGSDNAEFIELYNPDQRALSLDGYTLELINGTNGSTYKTVDLSGMTLGAGDYLVLCDSASAITRCDIDMATSSWIQNGGGNGDAIALLSAGLAIDSLAYEGIGSQLSPYAEGGSFAPADSNSINMSITRLPNGFDRDNNASDFASGCITPGSANIAGTGDCTIQINPVPLPAAVWLFATGLAGFIGIARSRQGAR